MNGTFLENGSGSVTLEKNTTLNGAILTAGTVTSYDNVVLNASPIATVSASRAAVSCHGGRCVPAHFGPRRPAKDQACPRGMTVVLSRFGSRIWKAG